MRYTRTFTFSAAHFNGERTYQNYYTWLDWIECRNVLSRDEAITLIDLVLRDCHGHDFKVEIDAAGKPDARGILVLDEELEQQVKRWDRTNISIMPEFVERRCRATTEAMAEDLHGRLMLLYPNVTFTVKVWEVPDLYATAP